MTPTLSSSDMACFNLLNKISYNPCQSCNLWLVNLKLWTTLIESAL